MLTRRSFLTRTAQSAAVTGVAISPAVTAGAPLPSADCVETHIESLNGAWSFRLDPGNVGEAQRWFQPEASGEGWAEVMVPHTWQISAESDSFLGTGWYRRRFEAPAAWANRAVRLEFEAAYHSAKVWLNGKAIGEHIGKGYTAFTLDTSAALRVGDSNEVVVSVNNALNEHMLPRGKGFDWTADGGLIRPVSLLVSPPVFIERIDADALPDLDRHRARLDVRLAVRNTAASASSLAVSYRVMESETGRVVSANRRAATARIDRGTSHEMLLPPIEWPDPRLWHFDHPHLYRLDIEISEGDRALHRAAAHFGVRSLEVKGAGFYLNGERVWLMGAERMAGSNPEFGMAEPAAWIRHDHDDLKELNVVFTRVHWQQDRRVLEYCDRHGILVQEEVPAWGPDTFKGMTREVDADILRNGLEQLQEMISQHRNHPCIVAWGLCNEVNGQNLPAQAFIRRMAKEARRLDPHRLLTYASNSLQENPGRDIAGSLDFISWNEYYESWYAGNVDSVRRNLRAIQQAFPNKPLVVSEYGYCECAEGRVGGDPRRIEILVSHDRVFREFDFVGGAIFFDYNDYRTIYGNKGAGVLKQRVHGVVDVYGDRKPSFEVLRRECSPLESLEVIRQGGALSASVKSRSHLPRYPLQGYTLRWIVYGFDDLPMEKYEAPLPRLEPGKTASVQLPYKEKAPRRIRVDVLRPTGVSVLSAWWKP